MRTSTKLRLGYVALPATDTFLSGSRNRRLHRLRVVTKPLLMPTLAASLATDARAADSPLRTTTLLAQVGGWGGDVLLLRHGDPKAFAAGAGSFGLGHAAYLTGFRRHRNRHRGLFEGRTARGVMASWATTAPLVAWGAWRKEPALGPAVAAYSGALATTVAAASGLDPALPASARRMTAAGALMFLASDTILGLGKFVLRDPDPRLEHAVMATYTGAQLLLAEGAARA
jgi:uncharacterized membrane protein YhhN